MKKLFRSLCALMLCLSVALPAAAFDFIVDDCYYTILSGTNVELTLCDVNTTEFTVPETVESDGTTYTVTRVYDDGFPAGIEVLHFPASLTNIRTTTGDYFSLFSTLSALRNVTFAEGSELESTDGVIYSNNKRFLIKCLRAKSGTFEVPSSVLAIWDQAFKNCSQLEVVILPAQITGLGASTFSGCISLRQIVHPSGLKSIAKSCFDGCRALESIDFNQLEKIGDYAFKDCVSLKECVLSNSINKIGSEAFKGCSSIRRVDIANASKLTTIPDGAFDQCTSLESVTFPLLLNEIGYNAFKDCSSLTDVKLTKFLKTVASNAFYGTAITSVTIPSNVTFLGYRAFMHCEKLQKIVFENPSKLTINFHEGVFSDCYNLENFDLPSNLQTISDYEFSRCYNLTNMVLPETIETIGYCIFEQCTSLKRITSLSITPPTPYSENNKGTDSFGASSVEVAYVPYEALEAYRSTYPWSEIPEIRPIIDIEFKADKDFIEVGTSKMIEHEIVPADVPYEIVWKSSNEDVATVDQSGNVTGLSCGTAVISATINGDFTSECEVHIVNPWSIGFGSIGGEVGDSFVFGAEILPTNEIKGVISWSSNDESVASVNADGVVSFVGSGSGQIVASCRGREFVVPVEVKSVEAGNMHLFPVEAQGNPGEAVYMLALLEPDNVTDKSIVWESSDESVAYVDEDGCVSLVGPGTAEITASHGDLARTCTVNVGGSVDLSTVGADGIEMEFVAGGVILKNLPNLAKVIVTDIDGRIVTAAVAQNPTMNISLKAGIYLIRMDDVVAKALIK